VLHQHWFCCCFRGCGVVVVNDLPCALGVSLKDKKTATVHAGLLPTGAKCIIVLFRATETGNQTAAGIRETRIDQMTPERDLIVQPGSLGILVLWFCGFCCVWVGRMVGGRYGEETDGRGRGAHGRW
jgi:hypothetical protein